MNVNAFTLRDMPDDRSTATGQDIGKRLGFRRQDLEQIPNGCTHPRSGCRTSVSLILVEQRLDHPQVDCVHHGNRSKRVIERAHGVCRDESGDTDPTLSRRRCDAAP
jgi:hypothetical protein